MTLTPETTHWKRMRFRNNKVWMAVDADEKPLVNNGKVLIKYQQKQPYEYWVAEQRVKALDEPLSTAELTEAKAPRPRQKKTGESAEPIPPDAIQVFTDGASSGNPGPSGIGVLMRYKSHEKEISRYIGAATNNIAELTAIKVGLEGIKRTDLPVRVYTDSKYALGLLTLGWKAHKNTQLVEAIRILIKKFNDFKMIKVKGHAGDRDNERADYLATSAIKNALGSPPPPSA